MSETMTAPLEWRTEKRKVKELVPYDYNPRILTEEKKQLLIKSIEKFNLAEIPAINTDNKIIAGHQRVKVMMLLERGEETIDVRVPNRKLTEEEFKQYNITSNVQTGFWDSDILDEHFADIDLDALGLFVDDIQLPDELLPENLNPEDEGEFDPEPPVEPITEEGDVYELKSLQKGITHRFCCGDSRKREVYTEVLKDEAIKLVVTDPPYNVDYQGKPDSKRDKIANDKMETDSFYNFLLDFYSAVHEHSVAGAPIYVFHAETEGINFRKALIDAGYKFSQCLIWKKNSIVMGRQDYHWMHEPCLYGWKLGAAHPWHSDRKQRTILEFDRPTKSEEHPTMKPLDLIEYLVKNSAKQKEIVFDSFLGSGSTLIACEKSWRQCRGIELAENFCDVIVRRWIKYMTENKLEFEVLRNGEKLTEDDLETIREL